MQSVFCDFHQKAQCHYRHIVRQPSSAHKISLSCRANAFQEKKEEEMAAKQPCTIPGYFDPATVNLYFPTTANGQDQKTLSFNM